MATRTRPALPADPGMAVLEDLDAFLEEEEEEYVSEDRGDIEDSVPMLELRLGGSCMECRGASTPLAAAVASGHRGCLQELLSAQSSLDLHSVRVDNDATLGHIAARKGELECLRLLLEADRSLCEEGDSKGATPLHVCAYHGHIDCLRCLLGEGRCDLTRDQDGATAIHFAAASGHTDCLRVLVEEASGDPNEQTNSGETPVYFAAQEGHLDSVHYLVGTAKADPFISSTDGMTPLHAAAQTGRLHITHWLVRSAKCPIMCRTGDGATPVHFAAAKGHVAILEWMLHHSLATGLERDDFGTTPIHDAADQNQLECLHVFYNHSVNLEPKDNEGLTPFNLAEEKQHFRSMQFLLNPKKSFEDSRRKSFDIKNAELRLLVSGSDQKMATKSRRRKLGFLSRKAKTLERKK